MRRFLYEVDKLRFPLHLDAVMTECIAKQTLVIVLAENKNKRKGTEVASDVPQRYASGMTTFDPHVCGANTRPELDGAFCDPKVGVDFKRSSLDAEGLRPDGRSRVLIDDQRANASPGKLIGKHQSGGTGADNQEVSAVTEV